MTYNAQAIEKNFRGIASSRIRKKEHKQDGGYWDGGRCEYGGTHNLKEDCQTLEKFFNEISELKNARRELLKFDNQEKFEKTKNDLIAKSQKILDNLKIRTSSTASINGICIIWSSFTEHLENLINSFGKEIEDLKRVIEEACYVEFKELMKLNKEERRLKKEIEENERKARNETDPEKKKKFLFFANEAKNEWKKVLERKKQLKSATLGNDFNPDKHINDFLEGLKDKLSNRNKPPRNPRNNPNPNPVVNSSVPLDPFQPTSNSNQNPFQQNQHLIILGVIATLLVFYFYNQPDQAEPIYYDF